jgi:hypothetical protein
MEQQLVSVIHNLKNVVFVSNLRERWLCEYKYEDFEEYTKAMAKILPDGATQIKGTKRPFGVKFEYNGKQHHIYLKVTSSYQTLVLKSKK